MQRYVSIVVCILCDSVYHPSCSDKKKFLSFGSITGVGNCKFNQTAKNDLSVDELQEIATVSLKEKLFKIQDDL